VQVAFGGSLVVVSVKEDGLGGSKGQDGGSQRPESTLINLLIRGIMFLSFLMNPLLSLLITRDL
jgi:hypothetical protein